MLGVDLVYIPEFEKQLKLGGRNLLKKAFNKQELDNLDKAHLAGLWAAKEAVYKSSDNPPESLKSIEIKIKTNKSPVAYLDGIKYEISLSHHGQYAVAVALRIDK